MTPTVRRLTGRIGAEIEGVQLDRALDDELVAWIRTQLLTARVLFFRGQQLTDRTHHDFASRFGQLTRAHPVLPSRDLQHPAVLELASGGAAGRADNWHSDVTFVERPPFASVLRAVELPAVGGETIWANTAAAYDDLPEVLRVAADSARAVHSNVGDEVAGAGANAYERLTVGADSRFATEHPVVRVHPETGERTLLLGSMAKRIVGLSTAESAVLIDLWQSYVTRPENTVRWTWRVGDVAFWDNRATQHYAVYDYGDARRVVNRLTLAGDVPRGVDGEPSIALTGDAGRYLTQPDVTEGVRQ